MCFCLILGMEFLVRNLFGTFSAYIYSCCWLFLCLFWKCYLSLIYINLMSLHKNFSTLTSFAHECGLLVDMFNLIFFFIGNFVLLFQMSVESGQKLYGCLAAFLIILIWLEYFEIPFFIVSYGLWNYFRVVHFVMILD